MTFAPRDQVFLIPSNRREFYPKDIKLAGGGGWVLQPDFHDLKALLREVFENHAAARDRALKVSELVRSRHDWKVIAEKVMTRIDRLTQQPVRRKG